MFHQQNTYSYPLNLKIGALHFSQNNRRQEDHKNFLKCQREYLLVGASFSSQKYVWHRNWVKQWWGASLARVRHHYASPRCPSHSGKDCTARSWKCGQCSVQFGSLVCAALDATAIDRPRKGAERVHIRHRWQPHGKTQSTKSNCKQECGISKPLGMR